MVEWGRKGRSRRHVKPVILCAAEASHSLHWPPLMRLRHRQCIPAYRTHPLIRVIGCILLTTAKDIDSCIAAEDAAEAEAAAEAARQRPWPGGRDKSSAHRLRAAAPAAARPEPAGARRRRHCLLSEPLSARDRERGARCLWRFGPAPLERGRERRRPAVRRVAGRRRPDPHGRRRRASEVAALARLASGSRKPRGRRRGTLSSGRVADDAWERFDGSPWAPCDRTGAFEHAAATARRSFAFGPPRPAPVARPPLSRSRSSTRRTRLQAMAAAARPVEDADCGGCGSPRGVFV